MTRDEQYMLWMSKAAEIANVCKQRAKDATIMAAEKAKEAHFATVAAQGAQQQVGQLTEALISTQNQAQQEIQQAVVQVDAIRKEAHTAVQQTMYVAEQRHQESVQQLMQQLGQREKGVIMNTEEEA